MDHRIARPGAALFPAALLIAFLCGAANPVAQLMTFYFAIVAASLCAADCFRNAAAREPGPRKADRRFFGSLTQLLIGLVIGVPAGAFILFGREVRILPGAAFGAILLSLSHLFEERLFALTGFKKGTIAQAVGSALLCGGLILDGVTASAPFLGFYTALSALVGALISVILSLRTAPAKGYEFLPVNYGFAPKAEGQTLLYPAAALFLFGPVAAIAGLIPWRLSRSICRRTADESRQPAFLLPALCAVLLILGCFIPQIADTAIAVTCAAVLAFIVYLYPTIRVLAAVLLLIAGAALLRFAHGSIPTVLTCLCAIAALALNLKGAFLKKVRK